LIEILVLRIEPQFQTRCITVKSIKIIDLGGGQRGQSHR